MKTKLYKICLFLAVFLLSNAAFGQINLLYVSGDTTTVIDANTVEYLTPQGYNITFVDDGTFSTNYTSADAYTNYDVIYFSEVCNSGDVVAFATAGYPIPCVSAEGFCVRTNRWVWITDDGTEFLQLAAPNLDDDLKTLIINNNEHYITSIWEEGEEVDWSTDTDISTIGVTGFSLDITMSDVIQLASFKSVAMENFPTLWAIPEGASINDAGTVIPVKIVVFGVHGEGLGETAADGFYTIIERSLEWVTDNLNPVEDFIDEKGFDLRIMPNPTSGIVNLSFALNASGKVQIHIYDITGKLMETVESGYLNAGRNTVTLDFTDKPNAQYIISVVTGKDVMTGKICKNQ